jgi:adenine phosphoribosyltransferase
MKKITLADLENSIRNVPDFPKEGILFKDITTALKDAEIFRFIVDSIVSQYKDKGITKVACIESRGFIIGGVLAYELGVGFVPIRKPGKLPAEKYSVEYELEYGTDKIEIHTDAFNKNDKILIHDDLLATGGTALATVKLLENFGINKFDFSFICELDFLSGRSKLEEFGKVNSLLIY